MPWVPLCCWESSTCSLLGHIPIVFTGFQLFFSLCKCSVEDCPLWAFPPCDTLLLSHLPEHQQSAKGQRTHTVCWSWLHQHRTEQLGQDIAGSQEFKPDRFFGANGAGKADFWVRGAAQYRSVPWEAGASVRAAEAQAGRSTLQCAASLRSAALTLLQFVRSQPRDDSCAPTRSPLALPTVLKPLSLGKITAYKTHRMPLVSPVCDYAPNPPVQVVHSSVICTGSFRNSHLTS